jgi:formylglycine-generating enzyme required for sulfatase activity
MYPSGQSLQGVSDLAGNIWEWCRNSFDAPAARRARPTSVNGLVELVEAHSEHGAALGARVIRGGSWRVNRGFARADFRLDAMPEDRVGSTGFRLACGSKADG